MKIDKLINGFWLLFGKHQAGNHSEMKIHDLVSQGDIEAVRKQLSKGAAVDLRDENDLTPLACALASPDADVELVSLLIDAGADVNASLDGSKRHPVGMAACSGSLEKIQLLMEAGASVNSESESGYTALINIMYKLARDDRLVPMIKLLMELGAETDCETSYGESPLSVSSHFGRFDAVSALLDADADPSPLQWNALLQAVALGTSEDVKQQLSSGVSLTDRDRWERTPWLLTSVVGDIEKAKLILAAGADLKDQERGGSSALAICAVNGNVEMLSWLMDAGMDIEAVDDADNTILMLAAQGGEQECVRLLLEAGVDSSRKNDYGDSAISMAANEQVMRLLIAAGEDIAELDTDLKRTLLGLSDTETLNVSKAEYTSGCRRRFGKTNPEEMQIPFWDEMVRAGVSAYHAKALFDDADNMAEATWCFNRFGISFTELPDGRFVQIGGEHEDSYDPDFCIYNEVIVHERKGKFRIKGYPEDVFPPTDFHTATYFDGFIYIIGSLGYHGSRLFGTTPVYRLNCDTWKIESVESSGNNPGWIFEHKASLIETGKLAVSGGKVAVEVDGQEEHVDNEGEFTLDLTSMIWTRS